jgi:hypothetical protein
MLNSKLQVALDELERLRDTVRGYKERNGVLPDGDNDASRALWMLKNFTSGLKNLNLSSVVPS